MMHSTFKKWFPGLLFLAAQLINTFYEVTLDTRTLSWAPHTVQVRYHISAFENGIAWDKQQIETRYGIAQNAWEAHAVGNLTRIIQAAERSKTDHPDSVHIVYSRNGNPNRTYRWIAASL